MNHSHTEEQTSYDFKSVTSRIRDAIQRGTFTAADLQKKLGERSKKIARTTDELVHGYAWTAIGIGTGLGLVIGLLAGRASRTATQVGAREKIFPAKHDEPAESESASTFRETVETLLPLALLALKTFQDLRRSRRSTAR